MEKTTLSVQEPASSPGVSLWPDRQTGAGRVEPAGE